jgi:hypothetical protein
MQRGLKHCKRGAARLGERRGAWRPARVTGHWGAEDGSARSTVEVVAEPALWCRDAVY